MNKSAIEKFAGFARRFLAEQVARGAANCERLVEEIVYEAFIRFAALRHMETANCLPDGAQVSSSDDLIAQCDGLNALMSPVFEEIPVRMRSLFPEEVFSSDSDFCQMAEEIPQKDWKEIEIVGWLHQFYMAEEKDRVIGKVVEKEDLPAATQLFTPKWIVQYMVENTLGRLWLEMHPDSPLREKMPYYIENPGDSHIRREPVPPERIACMDNACGSGHILVHMFDLLHEMYEECGYARRGIPSLILKNNLYGLEIDARAARLARFALAMKAQSKDRRFFERGVLPNVLGIKEFSDLARRLNAKSVSSAPAEFKQLANLFKDAKNYGSLLTIPKSLLGKLPELRRELNALCNSSGAFSQDVTEQIDEMLVQAETLGPQYDVCVTNPPYMGRKFLNPDLKQRLKTEFKGFEKDLFSAFIARNRAMAKPDGFLGFMTPFVWMFISSHEELRAALLRSSTLTSFVQLEYSGFAEATVPVCAFTLVNAHRQNYKGGFVRLSDFRGSDNQGPKALEAIRNPGCGWFFRASAEDFAKIPGSPIAYWVSDRVRKVFARAEPLGRIAEPKQGIATADNDRFLRRWFEVSIENVGFGCRSAGEAARSERKWFPYNKGGDFRKWHGNCEYLVNWEDDGREIKRIVDGNGKLRSRPQNLDYMFKPGVTWSFVSSSCFGVRCSAPGFLFDVGGSSAFPPRDDLAPVLAFLCSRISFDFVKAINPTLNFQVGNVASLPFLSDGADKQTICETAKACVNISRRDWDDFETSWDFESHPLIDPSRRSRSLEETWENWRDRCDARIEEMQRLETGNNRLWIDAYGLQDDISPEAPEDQITLARAEKERDMKGLLSYAVGCMMGRYSIDAPGLVFAGGNWRKRWKQYSRRRKEMARRRQRDLRNKELSAREEPYGFPKGCESWRHSPAFPENGDGVISIVDVVGGIVEFLKVAFGETQFDENLRFLASALRPKRNESPLETIRRYMSVGFYKDHLKRYKKRPIYWLFSSGGQRAFQALVYMHRYDTALLSRMRENCLFKLLKQTEAESRHRETLIAKGDGKIQRAAKKELAEIRKQLAEILKYDEELHRAAEKRIKIDLDDGVKINFQKFEGLVEPIPGLFKKT